MAREYPPEVKAAVMAALLDGQTIRAVADAHGVPKSTVAAWGKEQQALVSGVQFVPDTKKKDIRDLIMDLLIAKLTALIFMSQHTGDKAWLNKQDASSLALLLGVSDDKLMRLLERLSDDGAEG